MRLILDDKNFIKSNANSSETQARATAKKVQVLGNVHAKNVIYDALYARWAKYTQVKRARLQHMGRILHTASSVASD